MAWVKINDEHLTSYADSIRYAKDGSEYRTTLERAREEITEDNEIFEDVSTAIQSKTGQTETYEKDELSTTIDSELFSVSQLESKMITPETVQRTYTPTVPNIGFSSVTVEAPSEAIKNYNLDEYVKGNLNEITTTAVNIRQYALAYCPLTKVNIPNAVIIGQGAFRESNLSEVTELPDTITTIGADAFYNSKISLHRLPNSLTFIGNTGFFNCKNLQIAEIPESYTDIGINAFNGCTGIITLKMPSTLRSINGYAFRYCSGLISVDMSEIVSLATIENTSFQYADNCIFLFRDQTQLDEYATATNWSLLASRFQIKGGAS